MDPLKFFGRSCGECYACCVHLGIEELKKYPGQSCKHLDGNLGATTRCSVYQNRPLACQTYYCGWIGGMGSDDFRPDKSGILATMYPPTEEGGIFNLTLHVIDAKKSGAVTDLDSKLNRMVMMAMEVGCKDIKIVVAPVRAGNPMIHFKDGKIYKGVLLPPPKGAFEDLSFATSNPPVGLYRTGERDEALPGQGPLPGQGSKVPSV